MRLRSFFVSESGCCMTKRILLIILDTVCQLGIESNSKPKVSIGYLVVIDFLIEDILLLFGQLARVTF